VDEMKKSIIWTGVFLVSHVVVFFGGSFVGGMISKNYLAQGFEKVNAPIMLSHYEIFRDIAIEIKSGNYDLAICRAELGASSNLDDIRGCLNKGYCKAIIEAELSQRAPEIMSGAPLRFDYKKEEGGIRRCE
jgi:hypothetical protein